MKQNFIALMLLGSIGTLHCMESEAAPWEPKSLIMKALLDGKISLIKTRQIHQPIGSDSGLSQEKGYQLAFVNNQGHKIQGNFMNVDAYEPLDSISSERHTYSTIVCIDTVRHFVKSASKATLLFDKSDWQNSDLPHDAIHFLNEFSRNKKTVLTQLKQKAKQERGKTQSP
jgi:hypothetical protein